ncbi:hypothetical protein N9M14_02515 [Candidatus Pelagibacter bacterium]|nr:hypothetical protein [Candidatus Pelagibacter bacterium]
MTAILKVDEIQDTSGNNIINENANTITIGKSGDTVNLASGATNNLGITEADMFRLTANTNQGTDADVTSNIERVDDATFSKIGTGMSVSSGIFTFPSTGLYHVVLNPYIQSDNDANALVYIYVSSDSGSSYDEVAIANTGINMNQIVRVSAYQSTFVNVTDASTFRVKFTTSSFAPNTNLAGSSDVNYTNFKFIRLGDSQ